MFRSSPRVGTLVVAGTLLGLAASASAVTFTVDDASDAVDASPGDATCATASGGCTVRAAVMETNALPGLDRIVLPAGVHELTITGAGEDLAATGDLDVLGDLEIVGAGMDVTVLRGGTGFGDRLVHALTQDQSLTVEGMTLASGAASSDPRGGGGIRVVDGNLTLRSAAFRNNEALTGSGGGVSVEGTLTADDVEFTDNVADGRGGGLSSMGSVLLTNALIARNSADISGGMSADAFYDVSVDIADTVIRDNVAASDVGGLSVISGTARLARLVVEGNVAGFVTGGADIWGLTELTMEDSIIARNSATSPDGGCGGLNVGPYARVLRCLVTENTAAYGAGMCASGVGATVESCAVVRNRAVALAGGIAAEGDFSGLHVLNTTVSGNEAAAAGGLYVAYNGTARLHNCTITDNAASSGDGGGLLVVETNHVRMAHVILAGNSASTGTHDCSIDVDFSVSSLGFNLIGDPLGCVVTGDVASNVVGVDPMLGPLADNGGPTPTHELLPGSPALDGGDPAGCFDELGAPIVLDQRGWTRPVDGDESGTILCDIGALEHVPIPPPFAGLAIQRSVTLGGSGASPLVETVFAPGCRQAYWQLCPEEVVDGALDGMRLVGEGSTTALHSVRFYEHSDATQTMTVRRDGDDLVFRTQ